MSSRRGLERQAGFGSRRGQSRWCCEPSHDWVQFLVFKRSLDCRFGERRLDCGLGQTTAVSVRHAGVAASAVDGQALPPFPCAGLAGDE